MLPITVKEFIKGKLLPVWIISLITTVGVFGVFQIFAPIEIDIIFVVILASIFIIVVEGFIGLGIGSRYPDYSIGPRSRYVTFTGFLLGFLIGGTSALLILAPSVLYLILVRGLIQMPTISFRLIVTITTIGIGSALSYVSYRYCKSGIKILLSNLHV
jgi:ABC-type antimicrobial peptide transport system permease subunit